MQRLRKPLPDLLQLTELLPLRSTLGTLSLQPAGVGAVGPFEDGGVGAVGDSALEGWVVELGVPDEFVDLGRVLAGVK